MFIRLSQTSRSTRKPGFTLIEMLVAIAVLSVMMFLIYRLFFETLQAVSQGVALSQIHISSRTLNEQLTEDAAAMVGPADPSLAGFANTNPGFIVIHQETIAAPRLPGGDVELIRSDQLTFIADNAVLGAEPQVPQSLTETFAGDTNRYTGGSGGDSGFVRLWYGHVKVTTPEGTDGGDLGTEGNTVASQWVLGRQALFLGPDMGGALTYTDPNDGPRSYGGGSSEAYWNNAVAGYDTTTSDGYPNTINSTEGALLLFMGLADIADQPLGSPGEATTVLGELENVAAYADYPAMAYNFTYIRDRLWANPRPKYVSGDDEFSFATWQIAQMHPYFLPNVSDFIVEFAGDFDGDGTIDILSGGNLHWAAGADIDNPSDNTKPLTSFPAGYFNTAATLSPHYETTNPTATTDTATFVFRHDDVNYWPYFIRIRARIHDQRGKFISNDANLANTGATDASTPGAWYETIIPVNRGN